jgi:hypothetical protein
MLDSEDALPGRLARALDQYNEWILLTSITCSSLGAVPGIVLLIVATVFFWSRLVEMTPGEYRTFWKIFPKDNATVEDVGKLTSAAKEMDADLKTPPSEFRSWLVFGAFFFSYGYELSKLFRGQIW